MIIGLGYGKTISLDTIGSKLLKVDAAEDVWSNFSGALFESRLEWLRLAWAT